MEDSEKDDTYASKASHLMQRVERERERREGGEWSSREREEGRGRIEKK